MKKVFLALIFIIISNNIVLAQEDYTPCKPDCFSDDWIPDVSQEANIAYITLCGNVYEVRYRWRIACNTWHDYYIEGIGSQDASIGDCMNGQYNGSMADFLNAVTEQFMVLNPEDFPPSTPGECEYSWRVMKGGCFRHSFVTGVGAIKEDKKEKKYSNDTFQDYLPSDPATWEYSDLLAPCPDIYCCLEKYKICVDRNGVLYIELTDYQPPMNPDCGGPYTNCEPVCGSVYNR